MYKRQLGYGLAWGLVAFFAVPFMLLLMLLSQDEHDKLWALEHAAGLLGIVLAGVVGNLVVQSQADKVEVRLRASRERDKIEAAARRELRQARREAKREGRSPEEDGSFFDPREQRHGAGGPAVVFKLFQAEDHAPGEPPTCRRA